jgi:hypothetical protein
LFALTTADDHGVPTDGYGVEDEVDDSVALVETVSEPVFLPGHSCR